MNEKTKRKALKALSVAEKILLGIWEAYDILQYSRYHPHLVGMVGARRAREIVSAKEHYRLQREKINVMQRIKRNKWIAARAEGERISYELTDNGKIVVLEALMRCAETRLPEGWRCLVVFDFPEAARRARQEFRRLLKRSGFEMLQLSVWETKKDVVKEIVAVMGLLKILRWSRIFLAKDVK